MSRPARPRPGRWAHDLALGMRMVLAGGRDGLLRTAMAAVGVGLGVALLLVAASITTMLGDRSDRGAAREDMHSGAEIPTASARTMLVGRFDTTFRELPIRGRILRPEGPESPVPPGVSRLPGPGELVVSPALAKLLSSPEGALLKPRLDYRVVGTIAPPGLAGPREYAFYLGSDQLTPGQAARIDHFGQPGIGEGLNPVLQLLVLIIFVVLLLPIAVFIGTAVRFGGEHRDRRLAALRLVGADRAMASRVAAGEALLGALLGLAAGAVFFLVGRQFVEGITLRNISVFAGDVRPNPGLAILIALSVPVAAVGVALLALRRVVIEPLGVVRRSTGARRRLWWRLLLPIAGAGLLLPLFGDVRQTGSPVNQAQVTSGVVLLLVGVTALLPWLVEAGVRRLRGGAVSWQLAARRLQLESANSARMVNAIAVAVAGGIALQMLFSGISADYTRSTGQDPGRADLYGSIQPGLTDVAPGQLIQRFRDTEGVSSVLGVVLTTATAAAAAGEPQVYALLIADCATLDQLATLDHCADGDAFAVRDDRTMDPAAGPLPHPGQLVEVNENGSTPQPWTLPANLRSASARIDPSGNSYTGIYATPGALDPNRLSGWNMFLYVRLGPAAPDSIERVRNTAAAISPLTQVLPLRATSEADQFANIRRGLFIGVVATLVLLGASLLVTTLEQLRERRRLLAVLVAFGTRRSTMSWSVLWQTAIPVLLGLVLAIVTGTTLGAVLLRLVNTPVRLNWDGIAAMSGVAAGVVLLVTALSLPALWRLMRPDGLRTE
jgi:hypothetical protein